LEKRGDELRVQKAFLDALDYYRAALAKKPGSAPIYNKAGIAELMMQRYREAGKDFGRAIHFDPTFADAVNNLGIIDYEAKQYGKALKQYEKANRLRPDTASFFNNEGAAYFAKRDFEKAAQAYARALQLDPEILEHTSHSGISAQLPSPEDRAHYDYLIAKLCAKEGDPDRSLQYLRRAMEEGYRGLMMCTRIRSSRVCAKTPGSPNSWRRAPRRYRSRLAGAFRVTYNALVIPVALRMAVFSRKQQP
jgi:tetratricopeptide (TPR) repeat protein